MSRPARFTLPPAGRERLRYDHKQAQPLGETFPQLAEVSIGLAFEDGTDAPPSMQNYRLFPAARSVFRYACPCMGCDGEFDLREDMARLAKDARRGDPSRQLTLHCTGSRSAAQQQRAACPIRVHVHLSATRRTE